MVHRHTGGLEKEVRTVFELAMVHRHTGGLEIIEWEDEEM